MANLTLLDLAARTGSDPVIGLIEDVVQQAPELETFPMVPKRGTSYKVTRRTGLPSSSFRDVNEGSIPSKSTFVQETKSMHFLDTQLEVDEALVKGDDREIGDVLADEASGAVAAGMLHLGSQIFYGVDADTKGFVGLQSLIAGDGNYEIDAGGVNGASSSAYLVEIGNKAVSMAVGLDGGLELKPWTLQQIIKSGTGAAAKKLMAYVSNFSGYFGLTVPSAHNVYRVYGIDSTKPFTDALASQLFAKVPLGHRTNLRWYMNRATAYLLQSSRSSVANQPANNGGSPAFAPYPESCLGIPITVTDSLVQTEAA